MPIQKSYSAVQLIDSTLELASVTIPHGELNVTSLPGFLTQFGEFKTALAGITTGAIRKERIVMDDTSFETAAPTDNWSQRESRFLVGYSSDVTGKKYTLTIPTADLSAVTFAAGGGDYINLDAPVAVATFVAKLEAIVKVGDGRDEAITVNYMKHVARDS